MRAFEEVLAAVSASPAVDVAALSSQAPLLAVGNNNGLMAGDKPFDEKAVVIAGLHVVTLDYFRALRIPLKQGRIFSRNDRDGAPRIMVVNETAARALFPGEDPIGKLVGCCELESGRLKMIVRVVGDTRWFGPAAVPLYNPRSIHICYGRHNDGSVDLRGGRGVDDRRRADRVGGSGVACGPDRPDARAEPRLTSSGATRALC